MRVHVHEIAAATFQISRYKSPSKKQVTFLLRMGKLRACVAFCGESGLWSVAEVWSVGVYGGVDKLGGIHTYKYIHTL